MKCRCGCSHLAHHAVWNGVGDLKDEENLVRHQCLRIGCRCASYSEVEEGDVEVPARFYDCALEFRSGYEKGRREDGAYNPITKRDPKRRRAWEAGRQAGRRLRNAYAAVEG